MTALTQQRLKELLEYDPKTGFFFWRADTPSGRAKAGMRAGKPGKSPYCQIRLDGVLQYAHRLAWLYVYGAWPSLRLDHANGDRQDNRIANLREASASQNGYNLRWGARNKFGRRGVFRRADTGKFSAQIRVEGKVVSLGCFSTLEEAAVAYEIAAQRWHGEFARL